MRPIHLVLWTGRQWHSVLVTGCMGSSEVIGGKAPWDSIALNSVWSLCLGECSHYRRSEQDEISLFFSKINWLPQAKLILLVIFVLPL